MAGKHIINASIDEIEDAHRAMQKGLITDKQLSTLIEAQKGMMLLINTLKPSIQNDMERQLQSMEDLQRRRER